MRTSVRRIYQTGEKVGKMDEELTLIFIRLLLATN
jgi:hypothetical protein